MAVPDDVKDGVRRLFDTIAPEYDGSGVEFFRLFGRRLVELADLRPGQRVLDVGCGRGAVLLPAAEAVGSRGHVTGFDLSPEMVALLRDEVASRGLTNVDLRVGDAEDPPVPAASFDRVLASLVLFFLQDLPRALRATSEALVAGGLFGCSTYGDPDPRWTPVVDLLVGAAGGEHEHDDDAPDPLGSPAAIASTLAAAGFVDVDVHEQVHRIVFDSPARWLAWTQSAGGRALILRIPDERREIALAEAMALVDSLRGEDGRIGQDFTLRYTFARRP